MVNERRHDISSNDGKAAMAQRPKPSAKTGILARIVLVLYLVLMIVLASYALFLIKPPDVSVLEYDPKGTSYEGVRDVISGDFKGPVAITFADGGRYQGNVAQSGFTGSSTFTGNGGWTISGNFVDGYLNGAGSYKDALGSYNGNFARSIPDGKGLYVSVEGWSYSGDFLAGEVTGMGILTFADGTELIGNFENGIYKGE
jgi:hypothetical protein